MASSDLSTDKLLTSARVYIGEDEIHFVSLILDQAFAEHHYFKVVLDHDFLNSRFMSNPLKQMELIGKKVYIDLIQGGDTGSAYAFHGIIQEVEHQGKEGKHGYLTLKGMSPTVLLERGKRLDVFSNMDLQKIFNEVTDGITNKDQRLSPYNHPVYEDKVDFLMQYYESDWEFLRRLSAISGETLFYTGVELVFGKYKDWEPFEVTYDKEITEFRFGGRMIANDFVRYQYLPEKDETLKREAPNSIDGANEYVDSVAKVVKDMNLSDGRPAITPVSLPVKDVFSLAQLVEREKVATAAQTIYIKGVAKTCAPRIGRFITIKMPSNMPEAKELGTFRITKVKHLIDEKQQYTCEFEGVPGTLKFVPVPRVRIPVADSLIATVVSNNDPDGQGRVQVEFPFARHRSADTWLRVLTPDAGSGDEKGAKNRGMVFIPEVGSEVVVGFEFGDPNRPYVQGSLFTGASGGGGGADNASKSLTTRSGHAIVMNDGGGMSLTDKTKQNSIQIDGNDAISLTAADKVTITNGKCIIEMQGDKIRIVAPEEISFESKSIGILASDKLELRSKSGQTKEIVASAGQSFIIESKNKLSMTASNTMEVGSQTVGIAGATEVNIGGQEVNINS